MINTHTLHIPKSQYPQSIVLRPIGRDGQVEGDTRPGAGLATVGWGREGCDRGAGSFVMHISIRRGAVIVSSRWDKLISKKVEDAPSV